MKKMRKDYSNVRRDSGQGGFTLVELSIVLVIIGLIISSVLVGQDLIRSAELRATVTQYEGFNTAVATFKGKYGGLAGDVDGATDFGFIGDGDGDGGLGTSSDHDAGENVYFWNHLGATGAGLISGLYAGTQVPTAGINTHTPKNKSGGNWGVFTDAGVNYFVVGAVTPDVAGEYDTVDFLTPLEARSIDEKIDDSRPGRGMVQARNGTSDSANTAPDTAGADQCVSAATPAGTYTTTINISSCILRLRLQI